MLAALAGRKGLGEVLVRAARAALEEEMSKAIWVGPDITLGEDSRTEAAFLGDQVARDTRGV